MKSDLYKQRQIDYNHRYWLELFYYKNKEAILKENQEIKKTISKEI